MYGELLWIVDFWCVGDMFVVGEVWLLCFVLGGWLLVSVDGGVIELVCWMKFVSDEDCVVVSCVVVDGVSCVLDGWEIVDDNVVVVVVCVSV